MEKQLRQSGFRYIAGVDEVGRGAWAGPLVAAAIIMPASKIHGVKDSKQLTAKQRERLFPDIVAQSISCSIVSISQHDVDALGVHQANMFALSYVITHLTVEPDIALVDGFAIEHYIPTRRVINGDNKSYNIAAASIVAKVVRDQMMCWADRLDGRYAFAQHKGYGTKFHIEQLQHYGPSFLHRYSFAPVRVLAV